MTRTQLLQRSLKINGKPVRVIGGQMIINVAQENRIDKLLKQPEWHLEWSRLVDGDIVARKDGDIVACICLSTGFVERPDYWWIVGQNSTSEFSSL